MFASLRTWVRDKKAKLYMKSNIMRASLRVTFCPCFFRILTAFSGVMFRLSGCRVIMVLGLWLGLLERC